MEKLRLEAIKRRIREANEDITSNVDFESGTNVGRVNDKAFN